MSELVEEKKLPKFYVSRTSIGWGDKEKDRPCDEARWDETEREWILPNFVMTDLAWFVRRYKQIVLNPYRDNYEFDTTDWEIEIYDDYRE